MVPCSCSGKPSCGCPATPQGVMVLPACLPCQAKAMGHTGGGGEPTYYRSWWDLEMSHPSLTCVFSRVLQELKRRNEKRMAGNNLVTSNIKGQRDSSYYLDLSSLRHTQRERAGVTYLQNEEFTRKWALGFRRQSTL